MKKLFSIILIIFGITIFPYQLKIDYVNNDNIIEITETSTNIELFSNSIKMIIRLCLRI
ncbi:hypothetical protein [Marinitoga litoralis]|uniref:hypothetical protein n=1 Tax=Marinitoga litoralis TaxID=570855 RepID=UPI001961E3EE|nr:hypothetical protein [Marinitoga litoralis]MBM7558638.1 hypothetical protein [Marinitoga litoralis]